MSSKHHYPSKSFWSGSFWMIPLGVLFAVGTVWLRLAVVRTTYRIDETNRMIRSLKQAEERLELRLASLRSPRRLELLGRTRFKLSPPRRDQIVNLELKK